MRTGLGGGGVFVADRALPPTVIPVPKAPDIENLPGLLALRDEEL